MIELAIFPRVASNAEEGRNQYSTQELPLCDRQAGS
jgi:hypothetical protein